MMASTVNLVSPLENCKLPQDSLPAISEILNNNPFQGKCPSPNTLRRHSVAFPLPKIEVVAVKERIMDENDDSCPSSPLSSSSNSEPSSPTEDPTPSKVASPFTGRRCSMDGNLGSKSLKCDEVIQVPALKQNPRKRRSNYRDLDIGDEPYTSEEEEEVVEKPKRVKSTGPRYSKGKGKNKGKLECEGETCLLCKNGSPYYLQKSMNPGWRETVLAVFEYFPKRITESEWKAQQGIANDKTEEEMANEIKWLFFPDAYSFLEYHWDSLCPPQHRNRTFVGSNWRKTIQDTLSHNRTFFISGKEIFGKTGFWRLAPKAPSAICASILGDHKSVVDYNINNESGDSSPSYVPNNCSFQEILKSPIKEESRDIPLKQRRENEGYDFSKFDLLVAAIDHIESLKDEDF